MKKIVALGTLVLGILGFAGVAGAQAAPPDPTAEVTTLTTTAAGDLFPIIVAVATGVLALAVLMFGVRMVFRAVASGGRSVA